MSPLRPTHAAAWPSVAVRGRPLPSPTPDSMSDTPPSPAARPAGAPRSAPAGAERRSNAALRELIDEMLASIRTATNRELWTGDERAQYERELGEIMARVRQAAVKRAPAGHDPSRP